jgi:hypothetical protein
MKLRGKRPDDSAPTGYVGDHADKLSRIPTFSHGPDEERPTGPERETYQSRIESMYEPVPFPDWLKPRSKRRKRS